MARRKSKPMFSIMYGESARWRYHGDVKGNARVLMDLLAAQPDAKVVDVLSAMDPNEDIYLVDLQRPNPSQPHACVQTARAVRMSELLLRYGDDRLLDLGLIGSMQSGTHKQHALCEALKLGRLDCVPKIINSITREDHQELQIAPYDYGFLFYWAISPPDPDQVSEYQAILDDLLRLPPYNSRRAPTIEGMEAAFCTAVEGNNLPALETLRDRGLQLQPGHLAVAISHCACEAIDWMVRHGIMNYFVPPNAPTEHGLLPQTWAKAVMDARHVSAFESSEPGYGRLVDLTMRLFDLPEVGHHVEQLIMADTAAPNWSSNLSANVLSRRTVAAPAQLRPRRI